jgi:protein SCO1
MIGRAHHGIAILGIALGASAASAGHARAHGAGDSDGDSAAAPTATAPAPTQALDYVPPSPVAFDGLGLTEMLGAKLPLATPFRDQDGKLVVLGDYFKDDLPTILTFNYSDCPMLCSLQLGALATALPQIDFAPGKQFKIVTIDLEPKEAPRRARETRQKYIDRMPPDRREAAARGWTFLVARDPSDASSIKAVADAVGFHYKYVPERAEYAHPAALIFVSARGMVTRYVGGTDYPPDVMRASIVLAGLSETATSSGFIMNCFHYEPGNHGRIAVVAMRIGAVAFLVLFFTALGVWRFVRRGRAAHHGVVRS